MRIARTLGIGLAALGVFGALAVAPSLWLDVRGKVASARVTGKREELVLSSSARGEWTRRWWLEVRYVAEDEHEHGANVKADRESFDRTPVGAVMPVRYLPCCTIFARAMNRSTSVWLGEFVSSLSWWMLWLPLAFVALIFAARSSRPATMVMAAVWVASIYTVYFHDRPVAQPVHGSAAAMARVLRVELVQESTEPEDSRELPMPYQLVEFAFRPAGSGDTVRGGDAVDSGSVTGLAEGAMVPVRYDARNARGARLATATRTFPEKNRRLYWLDVFLLGVLPAFIALIWRRPREAMRATSGGGSYAA